MARPRPAISPDALLRLWKYIYTLASEVGAEHGLLPGSLFNPTRKLPALAKARHDLASRLRRSVFFRDVNGCRLIYIAPTYDTGAPHNYRPASHPMLAEMLGLCPSAFAVRKPHLPKVLNQGIEPDAVAAKRRQNKKTDPCTITIQTPEEAARLDHAYGTFTEMVNEGKV